MSYHWQKTIQESKESRVPTTLYCFKSAIVMSKNKMQEIWENKKLNNDMLKKHVTLYSIDNTVIF